MIMHVDDINRLLKWVWSLARVPTRPDLLAPIYARC